MMISPRIRAVGAGLAAVLLVAAASLHAQEPKAKAKAKPATKADPSRRVPDYFGQIGLTDEQRESIYKIQGKHQARIDELEKEIDEIRAKSLGECEAVLTDMQKQMLEQRRKDAAAKKKAAAEKKNKAEDNKAEDKKSEK
jgi:Spy/CpxP family protein refolding chaperone